MGYVENKTHVEYCQREHVTRAAGYVPLRNIAFLPCRPAKHLHTI